MQRKTIQRDITFMRDELKLPVIYADSLRSDFHESDVSDFAVFQTTAEEPGCSFLARTA